MNTREYRTLYYSTLSPRLVDYDRVGRACTLVSAVRAAVGHMLHAKCRYVLVENISTGHTAAQLWRHRGSIRIVYAEGFVTPRQ